MVSAILAVAGSEQPPRTTCDFDGFPPNSKLAEVLTAKSVIAYYGCVANGKCLSMNLTPGSPVVVYRIEGDWICGHFSNRDGAAPGWVLANDVRLVNFDPSPPFRAWIGAWAGGEDRVRIQTSNTSGKLRIQGSASWHGSGDVVHTGDFYGEVTPDGNHVHFIEGDHWVMHDRPDAIRQVHPRE